MKPTLVVLAAGMIPLAVIGSVIIGVILLIFVNRKSHTNPYIVVLRCSGHDSEARAKEFLEEKAERIAEFIDAYDDLADLLKLKTDVGDFPQPAYIQLLIPLGSVSKQAHGWYNSVIEKIGTTEN